MAGQTVQTVLIQIIILMPGIAFICQGVLLTPYGRHYKSVPAQGSNARPPHKMADALTAELWGRT